MTELLISAIVFLAGAVGTVWAWSNKRVSDLRKEQATARENMITTHGLELERKALNYAITLTADKNQLLEIMEKAEIRENKLEEKADINQKKYEDLLVSLREELRDAKSGE